MTYIWLNIVPILAATVAGFAAGAAWYAGLSGAWMTAAGLTRERIDRESNASTYAIAFVAEFWIACILAGALILAPPEAGEWTMAFGTAIVIWIGFVLPTIVVNHRFGLRPWSLTLIDAGHWLLVFLVQAAVLRLFPLVAPASA